MLELSQIWRKKDDKKIIIPRMNYNPLLPEFSSYVLSRREIFKRYLNNSSSSLWKLDHLGKNWKTHSVFFFLNHSYFWLPFDWIGHLCDAVWKTQRKSVSVTWNVFLECRDKIAIVVMTGVSVEKCHAKLHPCEEISSWLEYNKENRGGLNLPAAFHVKRNEIYFCISIRM